MTFDMWSKMEVIIGTIHRECVTKRNGFENGNESMANGIAYLSLNVSSFA